METVGTKIEQELCGVSEKVEEISGSWMFLKNLEGRDFNINVRASHNGKGNESISVNCVTVDSIEKICNEMFSGDKSTNYVDCERCQEIGFYGFCKNW